MKIHYIIHASFEMPGAIEEWVKQKKYRSTETHVYKGEKLPQIWEFDFLIIMGGPQSPLELDKYPYMRDEIALAQQAIANKKAVLGICLGAQIIAEALGVETQRSPNKEIGAYPIELTAEGLVDPLFKKFPQKFDVMHWHNDMPGIPAGARLLAKSEGCPQQAFAYGDRVYGLQFHMEINYALAKEMIEHCPNDLQPNRFVYSANELLAIDYAPINDKMHIALNHLAERVLTN